MTASVASQNGPRRLTLYGLLIVTLLSPSGCDRPSESPKPPASETKASIRFVDVTDNVGLDFVHACGGERNYFMPEIMGSGCAFLDHDNDGDLDLYFVNGAPAPGTGTVEPTSRPINRLFRRETSGQYTDVTAASGLGDTGYGMGVAIGDIDNDGFDDVFVTNFGKNRLYRNLGDGTFQDVTDIAGLGDHGWGTSAVFFDFDRDGFLDLYVANYVQLDASIQCPDKSGRLDYCGPSSHPPQADLLYRNQGDGTFTNVSQAAGIQTAKRGLGVVAADLTKDGLIDIYVANDGEANQLWVNLGDGTFRDDALVLGVAFNDSGHPEASMGVVCEDLNRDGDWDLFMTHLRGESNTLYVNDGSGFVDATSTSKMLGTSLPFTGFGVGAGDWDQDGDLDLAIVNGHVFRGSAQAGSTADAPASFFADYAQPGVILRNDENSFSDISSQVGTYGQTSHVGRGLAVGDADGDGDLDLLVANCHGPGRLYLNDSANLGDWLSVAALTNGRPALGAELVIDVAGKPMVRRVHPGASYLSSNSSAAHFGFGKDAVVDKIEVRWPDGQKESFAIEFINRSIVIEQGKGLLSKQSQRLRTK